jgi:hypothetical protein
MLHFRIAAVLVLLLGCASSAIANGWPPRAADLSVSLARASNGCLEGNDCRLAVQVENLGTAPFKGELSISIETAAPSVPGFAGSGNLSCQRIAYGRHACKLSSIDLAPGKTVTDLANIRFLPTPMSEAEVCASIDWDDAQDIPARDAALSVMAALGKERPASGDAIELLQAVFGTWGEGDLRERNDRGCARIAIGRPETEAACPEGQERIAGSCVALGALCSGNRLRDARTGDCACRIQGQGIDPVSRECAVLAAPDCGAGRTAKDGLCFCPGSQPLWNEDASRCEEWRERKPETAKVTAVPERKPTIRDPVKVTTEAPPRVRIAAKPSCGRGESLRGNTCIKIVRKIAKRPSTIRLAQRAPAREAPSRRHKVNRCPLVFAICIIKVLRERRLEREARGP